MTARGRVDFLKVSSDREVRGRTACALLVETSQYELRHRSPDIDLVRGAVGKLQSILDNSAPAISETTDEELRQLAKSSLQRPALHASSETSEVVEDFRFATENESLVMDLTDIAEAQNLRNQRFHKPLIPRTPEFLPVGYGCKRHPSRRTRAFDALMEHATAGEAEVAEYGSFRFDRFQRATRLAAAIDFHTGRMAFLASLKTAKAAS